MWTLDVTFEEISDIVVNFYKNNRTNPSKGLPQGILEP